MLIYHIIGCFLYRITVSMYQSVRPLLLSSISLYRLFSPVSQYPCSSLHCHDITPILFSIKVSSPFFSS